MSMFGGGLGGGGGGGAGGRYAESPLYTRMKRLNCKRVCCRLSMAVASRSYCSCPQVGLVGVPEQMSKAAVFCGDLKVWVCGQCGGVIDLNPQRIRQQTTRLHEFVAQLCTAVGLDERNDAAWLPRGGFVIHKLFKLAASVAARLVAVKRVTAWSGSTSTQPSRPSLVPKLT